MPTLGELFHLPTSHANLSRVTSPVNFSCQLSGCYLIILENRKLSFLASLYYLKNKSYFSFVPLLQLLTLLLFLAEVGPTGAYKAYPCAEIVRGEAIAVAPCACVLSAASPLRRSCVSKRSRCGAVRNVPWSRRTL